MSNKDLILRYETLRQAFNGAIIAAGGAEHVILQPQWIEVMSTLAANNIEVTVRYKYPKAEEQE